MSPELLRAESQDHEVRARADGPAMANADCRGRIIRFLHEVSCVRV